MSVRPMSSERQERRMVWETVSKAAERSAAFVVNGSGGGG